MEITIFCATSINILQSVAAMQKTASCVPYITQLVFCSDKEPPSYFRGTYIYRKPIRNIMDYNHEIIYGNLNNIKTPFTIIVQYDGYAVNANLWTDDFLKYDYIGAPIPAWFTLRQFPHCRFSTCVGNGGFSLRSRKWITYSSCFSHWYNGGPEDYWCSVIQKKDMENYGCKIAPRNVARRFSFEHRTPERPFWTLNKSFGFHGSWHIKSERFPYETSSLAPNNQICFL